MFTQHLASHTWQHFCLSAPLRHHNSCRNVISLCNHKESKVIWSVSFRTVSNSFTQYSLLHLPTDFIYQIWCQSTALLQFLINSFTRVSVNTTTTVLEFYIWSRTVLTYNVRLSEKDSYGSVPLRVVKSNLSSGHLAKCYNLFFYLHESTVLFILYKVVFNFQYN